MDLNALENLTDADKHVLEKVAKVIRKERATARAHQARLDSLSLTHQAQIAALTKERKLLLDSAEKCSGNANALLDVKLLEARGEVQARCDRQLAEVNNEVEALKDNLRKLADEKEATDHALLRSQEAAAADATLISQLREEVDQLRENKERVTFESVQKHARNMQLLRQSKEADSKVFKYEESNAFLKSEVNRVTAELVQTRTRMDSINSSNDAALSAANKVNKDLSNSLASANMRTQKLTTELSSVERHLIDIQADFEREKSDHHAQIENLSKLVEMHREAAKDAEIRLSGYTELLGTLAKETKDAEDRPHSRHGPPAFERHAEVVLKELNEKLDAKLIVLENERHELIRARASQARLETRQQALIREAEGARAEAQEARRQMTTLATELDAEKDRVAQLQRELMFTAPIGNFQSPSAIPRTENRRSGFTLDTPESGSAKRRRMQTPSRFLQNLNLGKAEEALANMAEIRRRHEALLHSLKGTRNEYGELMHDA